MKQWIIILSLMSICAGMTVTAAEKPPMPLAIFAFENNSIDGNARLEPLKKGLADMLTTKLSKVKVVKIVERQRMQALVEELHLNETELVDQNRAVKLGKILGAQILVFGGYSSISRDAFRIDVRLIDTETGETLDAEEETGTVDEILPMIKTLADKITIALEGINK